MTQPYYSALHYAAKAEKSAEQAKEYQDKVEAFSATAQAAATSAATNAETVTNAVSAAEEARDRAETAATTSENAVATTLENANSATASATAAATSETNAANSASSALSSEQSCQEILERLGTVIKIKGRVETEADLPLSGNLDGDAYLVGAEGQESYPEYYWFQDHWEFLGTTETKVAWGVIQGNIEDQEDLQEALSSCLHKTGDEVKSGALTLKTNTIASVLQSAEIDKDVIPSAVKYIGQDFRDKNNNRLAWIGCSQDTNGVINLAVQTLSGGQLYDGTGNNFKPSTSTTDSAYAPKGWVNSKFQFVSALPANPDPNTFYFIPEA